MASSKVSGDTLRLSGELTLATVGDIFRDCAATWSEGEGPSAIDLADAERIDSAGLALLLEWQARARRQEKTLQFRNAPDDLLQLAALCEASDLLGIGLPADD